MRNEGVHRVRSIGENWETDGDAVWPEVYTVWFGRKWWSRKDVKWMDESRCLLLMKVKEMLSAVMKDGPFGRGEGQAIQIA